MTIQDYQKRVDDWVRNIGVKYYSELTNMAILTEEVGEVSRIIARLYGDQSFKEKVTDIEAKKMLADEICDVYFVLTCLANQAGIDIQEAFVANFKKKTERDQIRHAKNNRK